MRRKIIGGNSAQSRYLRRYRRTVIVRRCHILIVSFLPTECKRKGVIAMRARILFVAALLVVLSGLASAQRAAAPKYDLTSEIKFKGVVQEIREAAPAPFAGTNLLVKTDTSTMTVYVGPTEFLKDMDTSFKTGDHVEVVGAKTENGTEQVVLAREITCGTNDVTLRDDKGIPVWTGWKMPRK